MFAADLAGGTLAAGPLPPEGDKWFVSTAA
jgi:hypothetical protein